MIPEGVRTEASDQVVTANYVERHIKIGIAALKRMFPLSIVQRTDNFLFLFTFFELGAWS
jgi:hypothetical protein